MIPDLTKPFPKIVKFGATFDECIEFLNHVFSYKCVIPEDHEPSEKWCLKNLAKDGLVEKEDLGNDYHYYLYFRDSAWTYFYNKKVCNMFFRNFETAVMFKMAFSCKIVECTSTRNQSS